MNIFKSKIVCTKCNKGYRKKVEKGKVKFICSGYHNKTGCTVRNVISEEYLIEFINRRLRAINKEEFEEKLGGVLDIIEMTDKQNFKIIFNDGDFMEMSINSKKIQY